MNKSCNKLLMVFLSVVVGVILGFILAPIKGEGIRRKIIYFFRNFFRKIEKYVDDICSDEENFEGNNCCGRDFERSCCGKGSREEQYLEDLENQ